MEDLQVDLILDIADQMINDYGKMWTRSSTHMIVNDLFYN
jgi:hypothetical protein